MLALLGGKGSVAHITSGVYGTDNPVVAITFRISDALPTACSGRAEDGCAECRDGPSIQGGASDHM